MGEDNCIGMCNNEGLLETSKLPLRARRSGRSFVVCSWTQWLRCWGTFGSLSQSSRRKVSVTNLQRMRLFKRQLLLQGVELQWLPWGILTSHKIRDWFSFPEDCSTCLAFAGFWAVFGFSSTAGVSSHPLKFVCEIYQVALTPFKSRSGILRATANTIEIEIRVCLKFNSIYWLEK